MRHAELILLGLEGLGKTLGYEIFMNIKRDLLQAKIIETDFKDGIIYILIYFLITSGEDVNE